MRVKISSSGRTSSPGSFGSNSAALGNVHHHSSISSQSMAINNATGTADNRVVRAASTATARIPDMAVVGDSADADDAGKDSQKISTDTEPKVMDLVCGASSKRNEEVPATNELFVDAEIQENQLVDHIPTMHKSKKGKVDANKVGPSTSTGETRASTKEEIQKKINEHITILSKASKNKTNPAVSSPPKNFQIEHELMEDSINEDVNAMLKSCTSEESRIIRSIGTIDVYNPSFDGSQPFTIQDLMTTKKSKTGLGKGTRGPGKVVKCPGKGTRGPGKAVKGPGKVTRGPGKVVKGPGKGTRGPGKFVKGPGKGTTGPGKVVKGQGKGTRGPGKVVKGKGKDVKGPGKVVKGPEKVVMVPKSSPVDASLNNSLNASTAPVKKLKPKKTQSKVTKALIPVSDSTGSTTKKSTTANSNKLKTVSTTKAPTVSSLSGYTIIHAPKTAANITSSVNTNLTGSSLQVLLSSTEAKIINATTSATSCTDQTPRVAARISSSNLNYPSGSSMVENKLNNVPANMTMTPNTIIPGLAPKHGKNISSSQGQSQNSNSDTTTASTSEEASGSGNSSLVASQPPLKPISIRQDLINMMHGFGDAQEPNERSIDILEDILKEEIRGFAFLCDEVAEATGSNLLGLCEPILVLKKEKLRLHRLFKYFIAKDRHAKRRKLNNSYKTEKIRLGYVREIKYVVRNFDDFGEISRILDGTDYEVKAEAARQMQAEFRKKLNPPRFTVFSTAHSVSFARKLQNFQEWFEAYMHVETNCSPSFFEALSFLTFELVAQIMDLTFIVRHENSYYPHSPLQMRGPRGANTDTCMSEPAYHRKRKDEAHNIVSEILVQASEMEAKRLKQMGDAKRESDECGLGVTPNEMREAYIRYQNQDCFAPMSYRIRALKAAAARPRYF